MKKKIEISKEQITSKNNEQNLFWNFLKNFDIFGITFSFRMEAEEKFQSSIGGLWLIAYILLSLFIMTYTVFSYFRNPVFNSFYTEVALDLNDPKDYIQIYDEKFDFGIILKIEDDIFPNDTFIIKGYYQQSNEKTNFTTLKTELMKKKCNEKNFISNPNNTTKQAKDSVNQISCFDFTNLTIKGSVFDDNFAFLNSEVVINKNANLTHILDLINKYPPEFQIIFPDITVDSNDFSNYKANPNNLYNGLEVGTKKHIDFYVVRYEFEQDLGILFPKVETFIYSKYGSAAFRTVQTNPDNSGDLVISSLSIKALSYIKKNRKYIVKLISVCQLQLNNLLNYLVLFKICATMVNFKIAKKHLTKNLFFVDDNLIKELKQRINDDSSKKKKFFSKNEDNFKKIQDSDKMDSIDEQNKSVIYDNSNEKSIVMKEKQKKIETNEYNLEKKISSKNNENINSIFRKKIIKSQEKIINNTNRKNFNNKVMVNEVSNNNSSREISSKRIILNIKLNNINYQEGKKNLNNNNSLINFENNKEKIKKKLIDTRENLENLENVEQKFKVYDKILDVTYFKKKMEDIELLKYLLLDKKSIYFFNFLSGKINPFDKIINPYNFEDFHNKNSLINSYDSKIIKPNKNLVEKKIIKLFEKFVKNN